jgi:hypothetical protein
MKKPIISYKEFCDWILQQPKDKAVNMKESIESEGTCGCIMIQYARSVGIPCTSVGTQSFGDDTGTLALLDENGLNLIGRCLEQYPMNFGEVITLL